MPAMGPSGPTRIDLHSVLTAWQVSPFACAVLAALALGAYWYLNATRLLAARGRQWPWERTLAFFCGLAAVDVALQSPIATFTMSSFTAHVIQHELLMAVAPPLLALGAPSTLLLQTSTRRTKRRWLKVLRSRPFAIVSHPLSVWFLYYGMMFVFFLTSFIGFAMEHMAVMDVVNLTFLAGGTLFWWPIIGRDPIIHWRMGDGQRLLNLLIGVPFLSFLGIAIMSDSTPVAPMYTLSSTHSGGALLWILSEMLTVPAAVAVALQWLRVEERRAARADAGGGSAGAERLGPVPPRETGPLGAWEAHWITRTGGSPPQIAGPAPRVREGRSTATDRRSGPPGASGLPPAIDAPAADAPAADVPA